MAKHRKTYLSHIEKYIFVTVLLLFGAGLIFAGFYIYTGKGWLLLERKETLADFYFNRGMYYFNGGAYDVDLARAGFEQALAHAGGRYSYAYYQLGRLYFITGDFSSALIEADAELSNYPEHTKVHYLKGLIYGYRKQYIQAEAEFKIYVEAVPNAWAGYNDLAWIYFSEGSYADAAAIALRGLEKFPDNPWLQNSYAVAEMNMGAYTNAEKYFLKAQTIFEQMDPAQWGKSYPGNNPSQYVQGLAQIRATITQNLALVHSKLHDK